MEEVDISPKELEEKQDAKADKVSPRKVILPAIDEIKDGEGNPLQFWDGEASTLSDAIASGSIIPKRLRKYATFLLQQAQAENEADERNALRENAKKAYDELASKRHKQEQAEVEAFLNPPEVVAKNAPIKDFLNTSQGENSPALKYLVSNGELFNTPKFATDVLWDVYKGGLLPNNIKRALFKANRSKDGSSRNDTTLEKLAKAYGIEITSQSDYEKVFERAKREYEQYLDWKENGAPSQAELDLRDVRHQVLSRVSEDEWRKRAEVYSQMADVDSMRSFGLIDLEEANDRKIAIATTPEAKAVFQKLGETNPAHYINDFYTESGDTLFSLASALRYNEELYNKALEMEKRGESREKIFDETGGMWKDKDGHWLIELPELSLNQIKELKDEVLRKINESDKDYYGITYGDILNYVFPNAKSKLGKLVEVYPRLASLSIFFFKGEETRSGYTGVTALYPSDNYKNNGLKKGQAAWIEVALGRDKIHKIRSTIVHELQHFIQGEEGWSNGTTYKPTAHTSDDKTTREIEYALNRGEINAKVAGLRSKPTSTKIVFAGKNVYPWETEQYIRDMMAQKVWNLKKKSLWTNANLNPDLSVEENARAFKEWYKKVPAAAVSTVLSDTSPQAVFDWFEKNMVGKTYVFDIPNYGRRVFRVSTGHIGKLVCTGSNKGVITIPLTKRWPEAVRNGEIEAKDVNGWDHERAKQLPRIPVLLTEFDAVLHEKDRGIDVFIFLKKFESKNGRPNTIVMKLVDDDISIGPISTHMRDLTLSWLKNKDLSLTNEGEVYNRSMNNSAIQRPPSEDNAERNSSSGINSLPHSAEGVNGGTSFSLRSPVERRKDLVAFHNVSASGLKGMDDLGGMAVPSFAVTKDTIGGNEFGEITLLVRPETIDPERRGNKIYTGDAWTPSFPETRIKVNEEVVDKIQERIYAFSFKRDSPPVNSKQDITLL